MTTVRKGRVIKGKIAFNFYLDFVDLVTVPGLQRKALGRIDTILVIIHSIG